MRIKMIILLVLLCGACRSSNKVLQTGDKRILIQAMRLDGDTAAYKVRIVVSGKESADHLTNAVTQRMLYGADSSFLMLNGHRSTMAALVQPVANGVANTFEYLVEFDLPSTEKATTMVYRDKYLTGKTYQIKLN